MHFVGFDITNKQREIIQLVYKFRFINRIQLQTILKHKDARRINVWLKDLVEKEYLGRIYSKKLLENTKPAIYYLSKKGIAWIKEKKEFEIKHIKKFYDDKKASQTFIDHCITLCTFYLQLRNKYTTFTYISKTELWNDESFEDLKPDAYVEREVVKKNTKKTKIVYVRYFIDLFDPHIPRYALRSRVNQYIELNDSYVYLKKKFPYILLILPDERKQAHLKKYIRKQFQEKYDLEDVVFSLTTYKEIMTQGFGQNIWETLRENDK